MGSFYGNIKNDQRISLIFDRIYPSRTAMEKALTQNKDENNAIQGDGVFINRYILIHYGYDIKKSEFYNQYDFLVDEKSYTENDVFKDNCAQDLEKYHENYHLTIWMKIYSDNKEKYILVGHLKATPPSLTITPDAPSEDAPHMDVYESSDIIYNYHVPEMWNIDLNKQKDVDLENINIDSGNITDTNIIQYPYLNQKGFDPRYTHKDETEGRKNLIDIIEYKVGEKTYPDHVYTKIILTPNTYVKNQYYYLLKNNEEDTPNIIEEFIENPEYKKLQKAESFDEKQIYYQQTIRDKYYKITLDKDSNFEDNTYYIYNGEEPPSVIEKNILNPNYTLKFDQSDNFDTAKIYYIKTQKIKEDKSLSFSEKNNSKQISIQLPIIGNTISDLYDILYGKGTKDKKYERPYTNDFLFKYDGIMPYDNLTSKDNISMAWAIDELKSYISELRFLSHGQGWRLLGYTTEEIAQNYLNTGDGINCIVNKDNKILTNEQINQLKPYDYQTGYIIPVYTVDQDDNNAIGLQSDWILKDPEAFGYIYHKPRMLWSDTEYSDNQLSIETVPEDNYYETVRSIEYIYHTIKLENTVTKELKELLFGKPRNITMIDPKETGQ